MWVQHAKVDHASKQTYLQSNWNILVGALFVSSNVPFWKIHLFAFLVQLIYAANYSLAKQVMPSFVLPYAFIVIRVLGACFLFFILAIFVKNKVKIAKGDWPKIVVASLFGVVFNMLLFFKGLSLTTPINAAIIMLTTPVFVFIINTIEEAITELQNFRANEGKKIQEVLVKNVKEIEINQDKLAQYESNRLENMRHKLDDLFSKYKVDQSIDKSRLEQELVYYIEKYDIQEEKNRLMSHCQFFIETIGENPKGKKLGFICQEMGREINTIGSKANYAEIQKNVVLMKENLEQMKEQIMNIV